MTRPSRTLLWPVLAVLLPCTVIGVLAYQWLAVEREARAHRGVEAAERSVAALRRDLDHDLLAASEDAARGLRVRAASEPPFAPQSVPPAPFSSAYLFDASGQLVVPHAAGAVQRADTLLARARMSAQAGHGDEADRDARQVMVCCAIARDEYGVSFGLYAARQRVDLYEHRPTAAADLTGLVRDVDGLIDRGVLGSAEDVIDIALLAQRIADPALASDLRDRIGRARQAIERRVAGEHAAARWLAQVGSAGADQVQCGVLRQNATTSMAVRSMTAAGDLVVGIVDSATLADWIAKWAPAGESFRMALQADGAPADGTAILTAPLFLATPALTLVAHERAVDPASDRSRERLFIAAVVSALVLTLGIGYLAMRDMSRELKTASLQAAFVAGVTHELKTPLASIRLLAETLRWGRARPEGRDELFDTIVEETDRLSRLVDNVLSSSRIESGTRLYTPEVISLADAVRSTVRRFESVIRKDGFRLVEHIDDDGVRVRADPDALGQAVLNLLGNAVKYSGASRQIDIGVANRDGHAEVRVADHGIGVPVSEQARIFEKFYRSPSAAAETTGAGLGLSLVRHFAEAHGGRVTVTSAPGHGSVFSVWLPIASPLEGEPAAGSAPSRG